MPKPCPTTLCVRARARARVCVCVWRSLPHFTIGARARRAFLALLALASSALYASVSHSSRVELAELPDIAVVAMPWHASLILGAGWPFILLAWLSGHTGVAPGSALQAIEGHSLGPPRADSGNLGRLRAI